MMRKYKYISILLTVFLLGEFSLQAQTDPCPGWKNPTSFNTGSTLYFWTARVGERCYPKNANDTTTGYYIMSTCADPKCADIFGHSNITSASLDSPTEDAYYGCNYNFFDANRHRFQIINATNAGTDSLTIANGQTTGMPRIPTGYLSSIRLGDMKCQGGKPVQGSHTWKQGSNKGAESLFYTMYVTPENALLFINYAIVARRFSHTAYDAGEFLIRIVKEVDEGDTVYWDNKPINDNLWYKVSAPQFTAGSLPTGWEEGRYDGGETPSKAWPCSYAFKPWVKVGVSLNDFLYQNVRIEMYTSDCIYAADPIYAYIVGDYSPMIITSSGCPTPESDVLDTLSAPIGMMSYKWYAATRGAVDEEYLYNAEYMDTVSFRLIYPLEGDTSDNRYNARLSDFFITEGSHAGDTASTQTFMCIMTSALDPDKPFTSKIYTNLENRRPLVQHEDTTDCDGSVKLFNRSIYFSFPGEEYDSTRWVMYADSTTTQPLDTVYGETVTYTFAAAGDHAIRLLTTSAGNEMASPCTASETFIVHTSVPSTSIFEPSSRQLCETDELTLTAADNLQAMADQIDFIWVIDTDTLEEHTPIVHRKLAVGGHTISLTTINADSCVSTSIDHVSVFGQPIINLGSDKTDICLGDSIVLSASGNFDYTWNSTPQDPSLDTSIHGRVIVYPTETTTYYLVPVGNSPCPIDVASVKITVEPTPIPTIRTSATRVSKEDPTLTLIDVSPHSSTSHWTFDDGGSADGSRVEHSFSNIDGDSVHITLHTCNRLDCCADTTIALPIEVTTTWFANAFTPDKDHNNRFGIITSLTLLEYELTIYNRNGQQIYQTTDQNTTWDGTIANGDPAPQGTYVYFYRYSYVPDTYHTGHGTVTLIR